MQWWDEVSVIQDIETFCNALPRRGGNRKPSTPLFLDIATCNAHLDRVLGMADTGLDMPMFWPWLRQRSQISHTYSWTFLLEALPSPGED